MSLRGVLLGPGLWQQENGTFPGFGECIVADGKVVYLDLCGVSDKQHRTKLTERTLFRGEHQGLLL